MLGKDQPINLNLLELPFGLKALTGVAAELDDCAFPLLKNITCTSDAAVAFKDADVAMLIGAMPRGPGMDRSDLIQANGPIFQAQGQAINDHAKKTVQVVVVGNPANTNCMIANHWAPDVPATQFTALTKLDHNRSLAQLVAKIGGGVEDYKNFAIWGNHSDTMYPDTTNCTFNGKAVTKLCSSTWVNDWFTPKVQTRGGEIIALRGQSSAASAGNAAMDHIREWNDGTTNWTSMAVVSNGEYGVPKGLVFSFPVTTKNGSWKIVKGLKFTEDGKAALKATISELLSEQAAVSHLLE